MMVSQHLLRLQLALIAGSEPDTSFIEIRPHTADGKIVHRLRRFTPVRDLDTAVAHVARIGAAPVEQRPGVWLGCAPRVRSDFGGLEAVERAWALWVDCDDQQASERLAAFWPAPSLVVRSGGQGRRQAWWQLRQPLARDEVDRANRRLARHLGSDRAICHAAAVMRALGSINHKHARRVVVDQIECSAFTAGEIVGRLPDDERYEVRLASERQVDFRPTRTGSTGGLVRTAADGREGNRNLALYWAARRARGEGTLDDVRDDLHQAAVAAGLGAREVGATIGSAER